MKRSKFSFFIPVTLLLFSFFNVVQPKAYASYQSGNGRPAAQMDVDQGFPTDQIIVKYKNTEMSQAAIIPSRSDVIQRLNSAAGTSLQYSREMSGDASVYRLPGKTSINEVNQITRKIMALPEVEYAEPDYFMQPLTTPNDPLYPNQWHYFAPSTGNYGINTPAAWDITKGASNFVVAVIDTGITDHPDLLGRLVSSYDFIITTTVSNDGDGRDADPHDPGDWTEDDFCYPGWKAETSSWHGTHTAGTIGAASNNNYGVAGVNWVSKILPVRVLGRCGGYTSDIVDGMRWSAGLHVSGVPDNANPAKVLSMSLGGSVTGGCASTPAYQSAINDILAAGATVVVAAGNSGVSVVNFVPATCNGVISVAATDRYGDLAYYSNYGSSIKISAPGGAQSAAHDPNGVLSTLNTGVTVPITGTYDYYQGTSMATPQVSGVASLLYSLNPTITSTQILQILQNTVTPFPSGSTCTTSLCGSGILNAGNAVRPRLSSLIPWVVKKDSGPINLKVHGYNFNNNSKVQWNGTPLTTTVTSSMVLSATIPAADLTAYGTYSITVKTNFPSIGDYVTPVLPFRVSDNGIYVPIVFNPPLPVSLVNGDFESGTTGWTESSTHGYPLIIDSGFPGSVLPHSGVYAVWLGGDVSEISYIQQQVTVNSGTPYLAYWHWIASQETTCGNDYGGVMINGSWLDKYNLCGSTNTGGWVKHVVNLSSYSGQTVMLQIRADIDSNIYNSNLFIDDVSFQSTPTLVKESQRHINPGDEIYLAKPEVFRQK
jgi:serine protease